MRVSKFRFSVFAFFPLFALMISGCTPSLDGGFDILTSLFDAENAAYQNLNDAVVESSSTRSPEHRNLYWEQTNSAFMEWKRSIDDLTEQLPKIKADWNAASAQERADHQADFDNAKARMTQILTRAVSLSIVIEPWTRYLMNVSKTHWQQATSQLTTETNAWFGTGLSVPAWVVDLVEDMDPKDNSRIGQRRWSFQGANANCSGSGALARCLLHTKAVNAVATTTYQGIINYLHHEAQSGTIDLGWTSTLERAVWFERAPGKSGPLEYNENLALHVQGLGYVYYDYHTIGVNLSSSSTPRYEWNIVPQWNEMSGQWIDTRRDFGLQNLKRPGFMGDCARTIGANLGWFTNPDAIVMGDYICE